MLLHTVPEQRASFFGKFIHSFILEDISEDTWQIFEKPSGVPVLPLETPLQLSSAHLEALHLGHDEFFLHIVQKELSRTYPDAFAGLPKEELHEKIRAHAAVAETLGLQSMNHIFRFIKLAFLHGWNFYEKEPFMEALQPKKALTPSEKIEMLEAL